jgi:hypothetical protein
MSKTKRLLISLLTLLCCCTGTWAQEVTIGTKAEWDAFATNVSNGTSYSGQTVKLTADIGTELDPITTMVGGFKENGFAGTFDGCGNTIHVNITGNNEIESPFRSIIGATIKNVKVTGAVSGGIHCAGLVGVALSGNCTIRNCEVAVSVTCSKTHCGGIIGHGRSSNTTIENCLFSGSISGSTTTGVFYGWGDGGTHYNVNCLSAGNYTGCSGVDLAKGSGYSITNCYRKTSGGSLGTDASSMTATELATALNNGGQEWWVNGSGNVVPIMGYYLIGSADDWTAFANGINDGTIAINANAKMTADIDLGDDQTHIGDNVSYGYSGVFDGQGHKLNVNYYSSSSATTVEGGYSIAPFRNIKGATIKNLTVTGNITGYMHCAGVAGYAVSPGTNLISNVIVSANITIINTHGGGFIGHNGNTTTTTIQDCLFNGTINGKSGGSTVGVFFGWSESTTMSLINCLENGSYTNCSTFTPTSCPGYAVTVTNSYYAASGSYPGTQATSTTLSDGTVTTGLNNGRTGAEEVWVQDLVTNQPMLKLFATKAYTVPSSGIGTFSAKAKFAVPDGLTAHYCKTYDSANGTIGVVNIVGAVPANTGVVLKGEPGRTYTLTGTNSDAATLEGNALVAVVEATHVDATSGLYTNFMMSGGQFIKIEASSDPEVKMPANRAYLQILTSALPSLARPITLNWENDATGISDNKRETITNNHCYDLQGRCISGKPSTKGLYIVNGKKIIIK